MSYYQVKIQEILQKAKERYSKEKAAKYFYKTKRCKRKVKGVVQRLVTRRKR